MGTRTLVSTGARATKTDGRQWSDKQQDIFNWFEDEKGREFYGSQHLIVRARAGCLAGDTQIPIHRQGKGWTISIRELAAKFNGADFIVSRKDGRTPRAARGWALQHPTLVQRAHVGNIRLARVKAVWASGLKETFTVTTETGRTIRATNEHPFMTSEGWFRLDALKPEMWLHVRGGQSAPSSKAKSTYSDESDMGNHPYAVRRPVDKTHPKGSARVPTHRLVVEAHRSGLDYQQFLWLVRSGEIKGLVFLDPAKWAVHHKDRETRHNTIDNLEVLTHKEHWRLHGLEDCMSNVLFKVQYERIQSIERFGVEETFDIEVEDDPHNFIANGFVVHNTGKTTTIIEGINRAPDNRILLCAFNKRIATELASRIVNPRAEAKTLHALGYQAIRSVWGSINVASGSSRGDDLTVRTIGKGHPFPIMKLVTNLHTKAREMMPVQPTLKDLVTLALFFDYVPDEGWTKYSVEWVAKAALTAMEIARTEEKPFRTGIDYADMIYQPLVRNWLQPLYDLTVVDEGQDMSAAQLMMAQRVTKPEGRLCIVGDDKQAIYGFRGADSGSLDRLKKELQADELPLNITYRCSKAIVREAQKLVPDIEAAETNPEGEPILFIEEEDMMKTVGPGDFILSRLNAPLVAITLRLLAKGMKASMAGRDIGAGVSAIIRKMKCGDFDNVVVLLKRIDLWQSATIAKYAAYGQEGLADKVRDQVGVIYALADGIELPASEGDRELQVRDLVRTCNDLFEEPGDDSKTHVICSSVHKAKGLETDRVYILQESLYRRGRSQEEENIEYVAVTRAKALLTRVTGVPSLK